MTDSFMQTAWVTLASSLLLAASPLASFDALLHMCWIVACQCQQRSVCRPLHLLVIQAYGECDSLTSKVVRRNMGQGVGASCDVCVHMGSSLLWYSRSSI